MRLAIVHDYLNQFGGAERVVSALHEIFPMDPIYTSIYDEQRLPAGFARMDIQTSFMQNFPFVFRWFKLYLLFYPLAIESFDLRDFDLILSSSSAWAKGARKSEGQVHICYCHTPMRFVWRYDDYVKRESVPGLLKGLLRLLLKPVKAWDLATAKNVDFYIANSQNVARRIAETYGRESVIINPPVDCAFFKPSQLDHDYFLVVSRLNSYKRIDLAVEAFNRLDLPLKIIGDGPDRKRLQRLAGPNVEFLGRLPDREVARYLAECRALIFPGEEDFGIVPLEAMACGRPVIAYRAGGAKETVVEGRTGLFFDEQTEAALAGAVKKFQFESFDKKTIREHALKFDKKIFQQKIKDFIEAKFRERQT